MEMTSDVVSLSITILLKNDSPNIHIIQGKFSDTFSIISSPFAWMRSMTHLQEETKLLREKNVQLTLQMESMLQEEVQYIFGGESGRKIYEELISKNL